MAKYQSLKDEEIVRTVRAKVTESSAATFTEIAIDTQLSIERGVIWMISAIEFYFPSLKDLNEVAVTASESITAQITRESKAAIVSPEDADLLQIYKVELSRSAAVGTDAGPLYYFTEQPRVFTYSPALPYASQTVYFGILGTDAGTPAECVSRVRYTIRAVSDKYFFRVAQALLG